MKKLLCLVLCVVLMMGVGTVSAFATSPASVVPPSAVGGITPYWVNVTTMSPTISSASSVYTCSVNGVAGTSSISITMVLYEKGLFGGYTEVSRTSKTVSAVSYLFSGSYSYTSGKTYRLDVSGTVTRNGYTEPVSVSTEKKV